ncbi:hypothetical protein EJB05_23941, partial [Eragrostis curvula]
MPEPASPSRRSDFPDWVLLDTVASVGHRRCKNATTARAVTSAGHPIEVSFEVVDPPSLSRCVVYCPDLTTPSDTDTPCVVTGADGAFLLIRVCFPGRRKPTDVFLYKAGPGAPSLYLLPRPYPVDLHFNYVGVLSCRGRGGVFSNDDHYCLVVIPERRFEAGGRMSYDLRIFSTETESWSSKVAGWLLTCAGTTYGGLARLEPTKVLNVGGGSLAWVDLRHGILLCNVLDDRPEMNLIRLPALMPANEEFFGDCSDGCEQPMRPIRDVTCTNGSIKSIKATLYRWTATMFKTTISSGGDWEWCCTIDSSDLLPANSRVPDLIPEIWDDEEKRLTLDRVISESPILNMYRDHVVYRLHDIQVGQLGPIDTRNNELERAVPF